MPDWQWLSQVRFGQFPTGPIQVLQCAPRDIQPNGAITLALEQFECDAPTTTGIKDSSGRPDSQPVE